MITIGLRSVSILAQLNGERAQVNKVNIFNKSFGRNRILVIGIIVSAFIISMNHFHPLISVSMAKPTVVPPAVPARPSKEKLEELKKQRVDNERARNQNTSVQDEVKQAGIDSVRAAEGLNNVSKVLQSGRAVLVKDAAKGQQLIDEAIATNDFYAKQMLKDLKLKK